MNITETQTVKTDEKPDAVQIKVGGITALVNLHSGVVTIDGANHIHTKEGEHNTLVVQACRQSPLEMIATLGKTAVDAVYANDAPADSFRHGPFQTRSMRDFPFLAGIDPLGWLFRLDEGAMSDDGEKPDLPTWLR